MCKNGSLSGVNLRQCAHFADYGAQLDSAVPKLPLCAASLKRHGVRQSTKFLLRQGLGDLRPSGTLYALIRKDERRVRRALSLRRWSEHDSSPDGWTCCALSRG